MDWNVGDQIVVASTSHSPEENEQLTITKIDNICSTSSQCSHSVLHVEPAIKYKHIAVTQTFNSKTLEFRAEVGVLTRNVVVRGSKSTEWHDKIAKCSKTFDPNQFATQSCYRGRYGEEIGKDEFGSQIMIHAREQNKGLVTGRISYVEVTHAGQAFQLGECPGVPMSGRIDRFTGTF